MTDVRPFPHVPVRVIVVGGGVAALETCLALRALAGDRVHMTLVAPNRYFRHRPVSVRDPLAVNGLVRVPLARLARAAGADLRHDRVTTVDPVARHVYTEAAYELAYDALVLAVGAVPQAVPEGAEPFDEDHTAGSRILMHRLRAGLIGSVAFVDPPAPARPFDLYDLVLEAAVSLRKARRDAALTLVTSQSTPLAVLGERVGSRLYETLRAHGITVVGPAHVRSVGDGHVDLVPGPRRIAAERVLAAPRLAGPRLAHLPCDADGFLVVDSHGRVPGADGVFAAGDCTVFPVKHPSLAAEQAIAVASAIASATGLPVAPAPFEPVLRCILPSRLRWYVEAPLTGGQGDATRMSAHPLWSPDLRFAAPFLAPWLEREALRSDPARAELAFRRLAPSER
jgi:sulfide:quinone oxidoreductase